MKNFLSTQKEKISEYLKLFLDDYESFFSTIHPFGKTLCKRLYEFSISGKMIRGSLVNLSYLLFKDNVPADIIKLAGLMELVQSGLLIHDDIMDRDVIRRGKDAVFYQYKKDFDKSKIEDSYHTAEAFGICVGDIAYFFAFHIISQLDILPDQKNKLIAFLSRELASVGLAQMLDIYWGASNEEVSEQEILKLYCFKTGRYTFSLPLWLGGLLAGASELELDALITLGENMGIIFQIKDDELDLFGDDKKIGKPQGSDLKEGKKTLYMHYLKQAMDFDDHEKFNSIFGKGELSPENLKWILDRIEQYAVKEKIQSLINKKNNLLMKSFDQLKIKNPVAREILIQLIQYNTNRDF